MLTWSIDYLILGDEVAGGDGRIDREQILSMVEVLPLDRVEQGVS